MQNQSNGHTGDRLMPPDEVLQRVNEEFVNNVKDIERRIMQSLHHRGYESHPDYLRYLQKAKELAIRKAGEERERMLTQFLKYRQEKEREHAIRLQLSKQIITDICRASDIKQAKDIVSKHYKQIHITPKIPQPSPPTNTSSTSTLSPTATEFVPSRQSKLCAMAREFNPTAMVVQETDIAQKSSKQIPINFANESVCKDVDKLYKESQCSIDAKQDQDNFVKCISSCVHAVSAQYGNKKWNIFPFGSAVWGLQTKESDIDLAIDMKQLNMAKMTKQNILRKIMKMIKKVYDYDVEDVTFARYPIIKIKDKVYDIDMDLSVADEYCQKTTQYILNVINDYQQLGIPVRKFIIFIKDWSKRNNVNNALKCYPNSFGYTLMALHFVHSLISNSTCADIVYDILPGYRRAFDPRLQIQGILQKIDNLIAGFFAFYGWAFDPKLHRIDITQTELLCSKHNQLNNSNFFLMVDPVNKRNNVTKNVGVT